MTLKQLLGLILLLSPFIGISIVSIRVIGILQTLGIFAIVGLICIVVFAGLILLQE